MESCHPPFVLRLERIMLEARLLWPPVFVVFSHLLRVSGMTDR